MVLERGRRSVDGHVVTTRAVHRPHSPRSRRAKAPGNGDCAPRFASRRTEREDRMFTCGPSVTPNDEAETRASAFAAVLFLDFGRVCPVNSVLDEHGVMPSERRAYPCPKRWAKPRDTRKRCSSGAAGIGQVATQWSDDPMPSVNGTTCPNPASTPGVALEFSNAMHRPPVPSCPCSFVPDDEPVAASIVEVMFSPAARHLRVPPQLDAASLRQLLLVLQEGCSMLNFPPAVRIWLGNQSVDMRRGFERPGRTGSPAPAEADPLSGHVFVFSQQTR